MMFKLQKMFPISVVFYVQNSIHLKLETPIIYLSCLFFVDNSGIKDKLFFRVFSRIRML